MANSPQTNVSSHVLVVFRKKGVGQHHYYRYHHHQCYLLQTGNDEHSWLPPFPRLSSPTYWSVSSPVCLAPPPLPPCPSLSVAIFQALNFSLFFVFFHPVSPLSSRPPPPPPSPAPSLPISPTLYLPLTPLSLSPSLTVCIASSV